MVQANTLQHLKVSTSMRRQVIRLEAEKTISHGITALIKYKVNGLLTLDSSGQPVGVVSKTDIMGAYYAGLPLDTSLETIMISPPLFCTDSDSLETALEQMRSNQVYRLYVTDHHSGELCGALAYPDIVGLLYQYCHRCPYSQLNKNKTEDNPDTVLRFRVKDLMTSGITCRPSTATVTEIIETLSEYRFGALLITSNDNQPLGVVSKTDLALAYNRGIPQDVTAQEIMTPQVHTCGHQDYLEDAIRQMIISDVHRLFVYDQQQENLTGVLSLTDAARGRSGSCHACVSSRIKLENQT
jgi:CBS domain-containing protein